MSCPGLDFQLSCFHTAPEARGPSRLRFNVHDAPVPSSNFHPRGLVLYSRRVRFRKVTIVGVGLLGGSLGLALQKRRLADRVIGYVRRKASVSEARRHRAVHEATRDLRRAVAEADLVILCTPLAQMRSLAAEMAVALKPGAVVTDVGSVKASVVRDLEKRVARAGAHFIGSHPMAGSEKTGVAAARADLFVNAICVVTPTKSSDRAALRRVEQFWKSVGGRVKRLSPRVHDLLVSRSSHLPHLLAAALTNLVLDPGGPAALADLCATGFRDTTRVASGSPEMWRDIALANRHNLVGALDAFARDLVRLRRALASDDPKWLGRWLEQARDRREKWRSRMVSPTPE